MSKNFASSQTYEFGYDNINILNNAKRRNNNNMAKNLIDDNNTNNLVYSNNNNNNVNIIERNQNNINSKRLAVLHTLYLKKKDKQNNILLNLNKNTKRLKLLERKYLKKIKSGVPAEILFKKIKNSTQKIKRQR